MDVVAYPVLIRTTNIGRMAVCTKHWNAGDVYHSDTGEGCTVPSVQVGQRVIITQVPACNPETRYNDNVKGIHKTHFVLVRFILDECGDRRYERPCWSATCIG